MPEEERRSTVPYSQLEQDIEKGLQLLSQEYNLNLTPEQLRNYSHNAVKTMASNTNPFVYIGMVRAGAELALRKAIDDHNLR